MMLNTLENYLREVERDLGSLPPQVRQEELEEISSHLQQLSADFVAQGHDADQAVALAIARFGTSRSIALRLRDVWEGNRGAIVTFAVVAAINWILQLANGIALFIVLLRIVFADRAILEAVTPALAVWACWTFPVMPFAVNFVLGGWAGRRAVPSVLLAYLPLFALCSTNYSGFSLAFAGITLHLPQLLTLITLLAISGAWSGSAWQRRRRWKIAGGASIEQAAALLLRPRRVPLRRILVRWSTVLLSLILVAIATYVFIKVRVNNVLHPPTPEAAVRVMLINPGMNFGDMEPSTQVSTRLLPAQTVAEKAGRERRVSYSATMHATEDYRKRRGAFLQKQLRVAAQNPARAHSAKSVRAALNRLSPAGYRLSRIVRVQKTPDGWQILHDSDSHSQTNAWLYDIYYEGPN